MARPKPHIITTTTHDDVEYQILKTQGVFALCYQGEPVSLKSLHWREDGQFIEYPKTLYANRGHCARLALKLNGIFDCDDFTCEQVNKTAKHHVDLNIKSTYN